MIDLSGEPDDIFKWIGHCVDHFSKYHVLFALTSKEASEFATSLDRYVLSYFGLPYILQSDNGREFVNNIIMKNYLRVGLANVKLFMENRGVLGCRAWLNVLMHVWSP